MRQILDGGPVTVPHPEMFRYFMTIPDASQLVLQAGLSGRNGEVCVLSMKQEIRILDLARDMIRLSGARDTKITFIGLRLGETLHEGHLIDSKNVTTQQGALLAKTGRISVFLS